MPENLKKRVLRGSLWLGLSRFFARCSGVVKTIILARILSPNDLGTIGAVFLALGLVSALTKVNMDHALLSRRERIEDCADAAWTISMVRGLIIGGLLWTTAKPTSHMLGIPDATDMLRMIALIPVIRGMTSPMLALVRYKLDYGRLALQESLGLLAQHATVITALLIWPSLWTYVIGLLVGEVIAIAVTYIIAPYRPRMQRRWSEAIELIHFGKWMLLNALVLYLVWQLDAWVVNLVFGVTALGYYQMARKFSTGLFSDLGQLLQNLCMPVFANLSEDTEGQRKLLLKMVEAIAYVGLPFAVVIFLASEPLVVYGLGEKWRPIIPLLQILTVGGILIVVASTSGPLFYALGTPKHQFYIDLIRLFTLPVSLPICIYLWGMPGAAVALTLSCISELPPWYILVRRTVGLELKSLIRTLTPPCLLSLVFGLALWGLHSLMPPESLSGILAMLIGAGLVYLALIGWLGVTHDQGPWAWFRSRRIAR